MNFEGSPRLLTTLTLVTTLGTGVAAGVFFAFSSFVMAGLGKLTDRTGLAAMQAINRQAPTPWFMAVLMGTAVACVGLGIWAVLHLDTRAAPYLLAGALLYLAQILLTGAYHVPRNNALDVLDPGSTASVDVWRAYLHDWTLWNHVRTGLCVAATAAFSLGLRVV